MFEKAILLLIKKGYSWDLRYLEKEDLLMLSYHEKDILNVDNFIKAAHFYVQFKEERFRYFYGEGSQEKKSISKSNLLEILNQLPKVKL